MRPHHFYTSGDGFSCKARAVNSIMRQAPLSFGATVGDEIHFLSSFHQLAENLLCLAVKESIFNVQQDRDVIFKAGIIRWIPNTYVMVM
jgi:hypothetical protein